MAVKEEIIDATVLIAEGAEVMEAEPAPKEKKTPKKSTAKEPVNNTDGFCVYLGPSIRGVIQSGTIYGDSKENVIASLSFTVEKYPLIAALIVSGETLATDRVKVKTPGNLLYVNYKKLAAGHKRNKEEI